MDTTPTTTTTTNDLNTQTTARGRVYKDKLNAASARQRAKAAHNKKVKQGSENRLAEERASYVVIQRRLRLDMYERLGRTPPNLQEEGIASEPQTGQAPDPNQRLSVAVDAPSSCREKI